MLSQTTKILKGWAGLGETTIQATFRQRIGGAMRKRDPQEASRQICRGVGQRDRCQFQQIAFMQRTVLPLGSTSPHVDRKRSSICLYACRFSAGNAAEELQTENGLNSDQIFGIE